MFEVTMGIGLFGIALHGVLSLINASLSMSDFSQNRVTAVSYSQLILDDARRIAEAGGLSNVETTTAATWTQLLANMGNNTSKLDNETVTVTFPSPGSDPLEIVTLIQWTEKGKTSTYETRTLMTQRG